MNLIGLGPAFSWSYLTRGSADSLANVTSVLDLQLS